MWHVPITEPSLWWVTSRGCLETSAVFDASHVMDFIQMTGDSNPIHTSSAAAEAQGMQTDLIASGVLVYMRISQRSSALKVAQQGCQTPRRLMQALKPALCQDCYVRPYFQQ